MLLCLMYITEHLSTFKFICHLFAHSTSLLISFCSFVMSSGFIALWQSLVSSANLDILMTMSVSRSFTYIYIRNSSGPNTLPYYCYYYYFGVRCVRPGESEDILSVQRPQPHTTNPWKEEKDKTVGDKK